jgi:hypothetical protein
LQREERPGSGCRGVFWRIIEACETLPTGFQERLLLGPTIDKGRAVEVAREPVQILDFSRREEAPRDGGVIGLRPDAFDIDADVSGLPNGL